MTKTLARRAAGRAASCNSSHDKRTQGIGKLLRRPATMYNERHRPMRVISARLMHGSASAAA